MASPGKPQYYIREGVRRAVAARAAGLRDIPAKIVILGRADVFTRLDLDQLHSPKPAILRDYRYIRDIEYRTVVLRTEPPAIEVEPLGTPGQSGSVPLHQVVIQ